MILLDTSVVSELLRAQAASEVVDWIDRQPADELCLSAVTLAELLQGVALLPPGTRRGDLGLRVAHLVTHEFDRRIIPSTPSAPSSSPTSSPPAAVSAVPSPPSTPRSRRAPACTEPSWLPATSATSSTPASPS
jgi:hypothetical protein